MPFNTGTRIVTAVALSSIVVIAVAFSVGNVYAFVATLSPSSISKGTPYIRVSASGFAGEGFARIDGTAYSAANANTLYACIDPVFYSNVTFVSSYGNFSTTIPTATLPAGDYGVYISSIGPTGSECLHFTVTP